jgi:hypothetical protein
VRAVAVSAPLPGFDAQATHMLVNMVALLEGQGGLRVVGQLVDLQAALDSGATLPARRRRSGSGGLFAATFPCELYFSDEIHPNYEGQKVWANSLAG